jgi:hypothetical protein
MAITGAALQAALGTNATQAAAVLTALAAGA